MGKLRKQYTADEKAKIALEALSGRYTHRELTAKYGIHSSQISSWTKLLKSEVAAIFRDKRKQTEKESDDLVDDLYRKIGELNIKLDWMKKKSALFNTE